MNLDIELDNLMGDLEENIQIYINMDGYESIESYYYNHIRDAVGKYIDILYNFGHVISGDKLIHFYDRYYKIYKNSPS